MKQQLVPIHTEYIQIDQVLTLNGTIVTEKRKKCRAGDVIGVEGLDVEFIVTKEEA